NVAVTRNAIRRQIHQTSDLSDDESEHSSIEVLKLEQPFKKRLRLSSSSQTPSLSCSPANLWHLRFGHTSSTTLHKLKQIKSIYDSIKCVPCIRVKKTRKSFHHSESKATQLLERVHSDICDQFPES